MRGYQYSFLDISGQTGADLTLHLSSDAAACELAKDLLSKSVFASLEMRKVPGKELICRIGRTDRAKASRAPSRRRNGLS